MRFCEKHPTVEMTEAPFSGGHAVYCEDCLIEQPSHVHECPFNYILPRTPYLVLPKLAIQAMPMKWRYCLAALLKEAEDAGIETPAYIVLRDADFSKEHGSARVVNHETGFIKIVRRPNDPWADYRHGSIKALCPKYRGDHS